MRIKQILRRGLFLFIIIFFWVCQKQNVPLRTTLDLSGEWQFALDPDNTGIQEKWYSLPLKDRIELPGTTDLRHKGYVNHDTSTGHLNRPYKYEGPAWYRKNVTVPPEYENKQIYLIMERTKSSKVWIDDHYVGKSHILQTPQSYDVTDFLPPGEHTITIRINNDLKLTPYGNVHIYTDETQTNWNGIVGDLILQVMPKTYIQDLQVYPDIDKRKVQVKLSIANGLELDEIDVELEVIRTINGERKNLKILKETLPCDPILYLDYFLNDEMSLWDDYEQPIYQLIATISNDRLTDAQSVQFGMRSFKAKGTQFTINGRTTFLRGKHDACVFPFTGHPPMDAEGWKRVYKIAQSWGINHYRFHSYCPPEAAFQAADELGIFLQAETPFWGGLDSDSIAAMLTEEAVAMLKHYGNHPSFVMFSPGNEIWSGHHRADNMIKTLKAMDDRRLYTFGSNNSTGHIDPSQNSEYYVAARIPFEYDTTLAHVRLIHAFCDAWQGGILNTQRPNTMVNFDYPVQTIQMPIVSHEIGQFQTYPDYVEIDKYTGVLKPWNLEVFKNRLEKAGMLDQNRDFQKASGAWAGLCYKADMEAAFRTDGFAGFQLLDLQDFPGQGTALVGMLDAFMDSKQVISREKWLQSCNDVVLLLNFSKYCWMTDEKFISELKVANFSNRSLTDEILWKVTDHTGNIIQSGFFDNLQLTHGKLHSIGALSFGLDSFTKPEQLTVSIFAQKSAYSNEYSLWVYPVPLKKINGQEIKVADAFDDQVITSLKKGEKVLLFPKEESLNNTSFAGLFPPEFWNYGMFKSISLWLKKPVSSGTLGLLMDPGHPLFNYFPTDFHSNWQWWSIIRNSRSLVLDKTPRDYRPTVQVIDNLERNCKLGLIFEFVIGQGKLLVCMADLRKIIEEPEANFLYQSILEYMKSDEFQPTYAIDEELLSQIL